MAERSAAGGSIYDLGYRPYEGERLGRRYAIRSLYMYSLRAVFGLGRSAMSKVFPIGLAVIVLIPAIVQLGVAAIVPRDIRVIRPENYFAFTQIVLVLFCAVSAPEIIGRDQRYHTLALYFSRALSRVDYVSSKAGALAVALLIVAGVPQAILFLGSAVAANDILTYTRDNLNQVPPILASSALIAVFMASLSLAVGSQTPRRALATGAVLAYFVVFSVLGSILVQTTTGDVQKFTILMSPNDVADGAVRWLFGTPAPGNSNLERAGLASWAYVVVVAGYVAVSLAFLYRRFEKLAV